MNKSAKTNRWPCLIITLGSLFLVFSFWSAYQAATRSSAVTDRNYYSHGLKYNRSLVEQKAAEGMGWSLNAVIAGQRLEIRLSDRDGKPVAGCRGETQLLNVSRLNSLRLNLEEAEPGLYVARLGENLLGEISARLELSRDGARISRRLQLNL